MYFFRNMTYKNLIFVFEKRMYKWKMFWNINQANNSKARTRANPTLNVNILNSLNGHSERLILYFTQFISESDKRNVNHGHERRINNMQLNSITDSQCDS